MDFLNYRDIEIEILKVGFNNAFSKIYKYLRKNNSLKLEEYLVIFDLAETFKQGRVIFNKLAENIKEYPNLHNIAIRVMWKDLVDKKDAESAIIFYKNSFSDSLNLEILHNPAMIHYEKILQQKRLEELQDKYKKIFTDSLENSRFDKTNKYISSYPRSEKVKKEALEKSRYHCFIDNRHKDFISKSTNKNYVEVHHVIPLSYQHEYEISLDCVENIICLCATCHRLLHFGKFEAKKSKIDTLFLNKQRELKSIGLNIDLKRMYEIYSDIKIETEE